MNIDGLIKDAFEIEVEYNRSRTPRPRNIPIPLKRETPKKDAFVSWFRTLLASCIMIALFLGVLALKDRIYESHSIYGDVGMSVMFPENPAQSFYDFLSATHSSYEE
ncbi:MAG: hypothetical protein LBB61_00250 [Treponema sp.]|jgi:hypothetical protein|nr:hypothetical protein [Treponema sp.]